MTVDRGPLRVAFCHFTADVCGGADFCLWNLVTALPRDAVVPLMILKTGDPMAARYRAEGIEAVELPLVPPRRALEFGKLARYFLSFGPSVFHVARAIRRFRADLVHVNTLYNLQGGFAARVARRPLVWHIREMGSDSRLARMMLRCVALFATRAVAMSNAIAGTLEACGSRRRMIYDGIDLSRFEDVAGVDTLREELGLDRDAALVTCASRIEPWKGQHVLIEAAPRILETCPQARILIVGGAAVNKPEYERGLRDRCESLGIADRVIFTGIRNDIPRVMAASNVMVLPSATPEPFGLTVVEAMASRCPVVATAAGGPLESVVNGETGWLVPPNDPEAMAERIVHVLDDSVKAKRMGDQGYARAHACFSRERYAREMTELFRELVR